MTAESERKRPDGILTTSVGILYLAGLDGSPRGERLGLFRMAGRPCVCGDNIGEVLSDL